MWCIDMDKQQISNQEGLIVYWLCADDGEYQVTLPADVELSVLRREQILAEARLMLKKLTLEPIARNASESIKSLASA